ncbi:MAG TPA: FdrA family protein [Actinomycetes bacterium]|nr:FdrA family protein [Actinomycetes bacterium]
MPSVVEVRHGSYHDSVSLMQVSKAVSLVPGVRAALVAMGTELNLDLLAGMGFGPAPSASPSDLLVAVEAADDESLQAALSTCDAELAALSRGSAHDGSGSLAPARSLGSAARRLDATLALVSVPGPQAFVEAMDALDAGLSVMLFSDNVPVEAEIALKDTAAARDLLVMGPDCGTAVVGGVGLGFANVVRPGSVGLVAASGTGAQQMLSLLDAAGVGVSHCLGVGGRDLSAAVGARSTRAALAALDADPETDMLVVVSKPPAPEVAEAVRAYAATLSTPVVLVLIGEGQPDLTAGAEKVLAARGEAVPQWPSWQPSEPRPPRPGALRGLFSGGTLCDEAMVIAAATLGTVRSNIPLRPEWALPADLRSPDHLMIDFGDDALTQGRAHPMIDPTLRLERLAAEVTDPATGVVLLDVVLGHGSHPDPGRELADVVRRSEVPVVVSLCGTESDPQGLSRQAEALASAGAEVYLSNAAAARRAVTLVEQAKENHQ